MSASCPPASLEETCIILQRTDAAGDTSHYFAAATELLIRLLNDRGGRMLAMRRRTLLIALCLFGAACGADQARQSPPEREGPQVNWDNPIHGIVVDSIQAAQQMVSFTIYQPNALGIQRPLLVTGPFESTPDQRAIAFLYDTAAYGEVVILEGPPEVNRADWDAMLDTQVANNSLPGTHGAAEIVTIRGSLRALRYSSETGATAVLQWLQGTVEFWVEGPTLSPAQVVEIANAI